MDAAKLMSLMKSKKASLKQRDKTLKPTDGSNRYVLLQGWRKGEEHVWFHDYGQHFVKNAAGELVAVYLCLDKTLGNPCPVCEGLNRATRATTDDDTLKTLKEAGSGQRYLVNVLALDTDNETTPQILEIGKLAFSQLVEVVEEWGATIFDSAEPQIVTISRSGKGLLTKYSVQVSPKKFAMPKGIVAKINNLDEYVRQESEEGQRKAITAINTVAGLLAAPTTADTPKTGRKAPSMDFDAADDEPVRPKAASRPASANEPSLDDELNELLNGTD